MVTKYLIYTIMYKIEARSFIRYKTIRKPHIFIFITQEDNKLQIREYICKYLKTNFDLRAIFINWQDFISYYQKPRMLNFDTILFTYSSYIIDTIDNPNETEFESFYNYCIGLIMKRGWKKIIEERSNNENLLGKFTISFNVQYFRDKDSKLAKIDSIDISNVNTKKRKTEEYIDILCKKSRCLITKDIKNKNANTKNELSDIKIYKSKKFVNPISKINLFQDLDNNKLIRFPTTELKDKNILQQNNKEKYNDIYNIKESTNCQTLLQNKKCDSTTHIDEVRFGKEKFMKSNSELSFIPQIHKQMNDSLKYSPNMNQTNVKAIQCDLLINKTFHKNISFDSSCQIHKTETLKFLNIYTNKLDNFCHKCSRKTNLHVFNKLNGEDYTKQNLDTKYTQILDLSIRKTK